MSLQKTTATASRAAARPSPRSVLFVTGQLGIGGAERQLYLLACGLLSNGIEVAVVSLNGGHDDYWETQFRAAGVALECVRASAGRSTRLFEIVRCARRKRPDVIHSWTVHTNFYAAAAAASCSSRAVGSDRSSHRASRHHLGALRYQLSVRGLHAFVVNSRAAAHAARAFGVSASVISVPNAVETPSLSDDTREEIRREFHFAQDTFAFAGVGALRPGKRWPVVLDALRMVLARGARVAFVLFGDGPDRGVLEQQCRGHNLQASVTFAGARPNVRTALHGFDAGCFASIDEGMPNAVMEMCAAGLPVVASNSAGIPEVVAHGDTGLLVDGAAPSFADAMSCLASDRRRASTMGRRGRERMSEEFSPSRLTQRMLAVYSQL
jgi:glycosyltransferase involved in cell wall biosynthesis